MRKALSYNPNEKIYNTFRLPKSKRKKKHKKSNNKKPLN